MNHVTARLQAYYDGELEPRARTHVEAHLSECEACCVELERLETLSGLLREAPLLRPMTSEDQFVAEIALRLPRKAFTSLPERTLKWGWKLTPVLLVATWVLVQTTSLLTIGIEALLNLGVGGDSLASWIATQTTANGLGGANCLVEALGISTPAENLWLLSVVRLGAVMPAIFTVLIALGICSWVAMWWTAQQHS